MIKSNHSFIKHEQESTLKFKSYILITLMITIKMIMMFILLLMKIINLTLINHASAHKINQTFNQKFETEIYFST